MSTEKPKLYILTDQGSVHLAIITPHTKIKGSPKPPVDKKNGQEIGEAPQSIESANRAFKSYWSSLPEATSSSEHESIIYVSDSSNNAEKATDISGKSAQLCYTLLLASLKLSFHDKISAIAATGAISPPEESGQYCVNKVDTSSIQKKLEAAVEFFIKEKLKKSIILYPSANHEEIKNCDWFKTLQESSNQNGITLKNVKTVPEAIESCFTKPDTTTRNNKESTGVSFTHFFIGCSIIGLLGLGFVYYYKINKNLPPTTNPAVASYNQHDQVTPPVSIPVQEKLTTQVKPKNPLLNPGYQACN